MNSVGGLEVASLGAFSLPHDITANDDGSLLYVADRENARIQVFRSNGEPVAQIVNPANNTAFWNVYSAHYHSKFFANLSKVALLFICSKIIISGSK